MDKDVRFYDTSSLLLAGESLFQNDEHFVISSITLKELERIKTSNNKEADVKHAARLLLHRLWEYPQKFTVIIHKTSFEELLTKHNIPVTDDSRILIDAYICNEKQYIDRVIFVTNDISLACTANLFFGNGMIEKYIPKVEEYCGYADICASEQELEDYYQDSTQNIFNLKIGQYLILRNHDNEVIDLRVWNGQEYRYLKYEDFNSHWFGKVTPYKNDLYQKLLFDSLCNNMFTVIRGPAGVGKSYIALAYLMYQLERGKIDNIVVFCNTVATRDAAKLGYYPGDRNQKLLDSQIGNFLSGKFGGIEGVQRLIDSGKLTLIPVADARGVDIKSGTGVYVTEAQNTSVDIMQLILQRIGEDCICIIEGDDKSQVDLTAYAGSNNGLRKVSEVFSGESYYGEVTLKNCYRSKIANRAELMREW